MFHTAHPIQIVLFSLIFLIVLPSHLDGPQRQCSCITAFRMLIDLIEKLQIFYKKQ